VIFIAGAGFDPRATAVAFKFSSVQQIIATLLIKEERPEPPGELITFASKNKTILEELLPNCSTCHIDILSKDDGAVVGDRNALYRVQSFINKYEHMLTDIVVDMSALSIGISFPIISFLRGISINKGTNLHIFVAHDPGLDSSLESTPCETEKYIHGFSASIKNDEDKNRTKLWLPLLSLSRKGILKRLHSFVSPHETCPIIPFPAKDVKLTDKLLEAFSSELTSSWSVDSRDIVFASEDDPLDLYRTILNLNDLRTMVFQETGGSTLILSPVSSKLMALGCLMAALEHNLPVAYIESMGYNYSLASNGRKDDVPLLFHLWMEGDAYPRLTNL
jgi:hypothetical protein